jgi:prophage regulatory protein
MQESQAATALRVERLPVVLARTGMRRAWTYNEIQHGRFPRPVKLGVRAVAWRSADIDAWIASRMTANGEASQ